jgi:hypothetical protein
MIALVHGAVGAACGALLQRRRPTVAVALLSHLVVDAVSHEEPFDKRGNLRLDVAAFDGLLTGLALLVVGSRYGVLSPESLGAVAGCFPDVGHLVERWGTGSGSVHGWFPHARWPSRKMGVWWQLSIGVIGWLALIRYHAPSEMRSRAAARRSLAG